MKKHLGCAAAIAALVLCAGASTAAPAKHDGGDGAAKGQGGGGQGGGEGWQANWRQFDAEFAALDKRFAKDSANPVPPGICMTSRVSCSQQPRILEDAQVTSIRSEISQLENNEKRMFAQQKNAKQGNAAAWQGIVSSIKSINDELTKAENTWSPTMIQFQQSLLLARELHDQQMLSGKNLTLCTPTQLRMPNPADQLQQLMAKANTMEQANAGKHHAVPGNYTYPLTQADLEQLQPEFEAVHKQVQQCLGKNARASPYAKGHAG